VTLTNRIENEVCKISSEITNLTRPIPSGTNFHKNPTSHNTHYPSNSLSRHPTISHTLPSFSPSTFLQQQPASPQLQLYIYTNVNPLLFSQHYSQLLDQNQACLQGWAVAIIHKSISRRLPNVRTQLVFRIACTRSRSPGVII
jgi:hypothetical protein